MPGHTIVTWLRYGVLSEGLSMFESDLEETGRITGRGKEKAVIEAQPTLRQTSRFRAADEDEAMSGGLRHAADVWRKVTAKRRQSRKS
jgi:hypothetical protein